MKSLGLVLLLLLAIVSVSFAAKRHEGEDHNDDDRQKEWDRDVSLTTQRPDEIEFRSSSKDATTETKVRFRLTTEDRFRMELRVEADGVDSRMRFEPLELIEFNESGQNIGYQSQEDGLVDSIDLNDDDDRRRAAQWNPIHCESGADKNFTCDVFTRDGQFGIVVHIASTVTTIDGIPLRPTSVKLDIIVNKSSRTAGTKLALVAKFQAKESTQVKSESDEQTEGFVKDRERQVSFGTVGFFSWAETAIVNGQTFNVLNSQLLDAQAVNGEENEGPCHAITFTFDTTQDGEIVWDPKFSWSPTSSSAFLVPSVLLLTLLALFFYL